VAEGFRAGIRLRRIARQLKRWRADSGMKAADVAARLRWSATKLSKVENAAQPIAPVDVLGLALVYNIAEIERDILFEATIDAQANQWWQDYDEHELLISAQDALELEEEATLERTFKIDLIPGLLQTQGYMTALARADRPLISPETVDRRTEVRVTRQAVLTADPPLEVAAVISEAALHVQVGGRKIMRSQLERLVELAAAPNITLQVLPQEAGAYSTMGSAFDILSFAEEHYDDVVYLENLRYGLLMEESGPVEEYKLNFAGLQDQALDPTRSVERITKVISRLKH
jgi:YD repeat-containing protein